MLYNTAFNFYHEHEHEFSLLLTVTLALFQVTEIRLKYFDTVPVAASMSVLKSGFLFIAAEFGNQ